MLAKIMIIDDNEDNRELLFRYLKNDFKVCLCPSAADALEKLKENHFDLVLCDVQMPGMDGLAFTRALRQDRRLALTPVILYSAQLLVDRTEGLLCGADDFLVKPIDPHELKLKIGRLLEAVGDRSAQLGLGSFFLREFRQFLTDLNLDIKAGRTQEAGEKVSHWLGHLSDL